MKLLTSSLYLTIAALTLAACSNPTAPDVRKTLDLTTAWRFHLGDVTDGQRKDLNDTTWRLLDLPHDWSIEGSFSEDHPAGVGGGALPGGIGWYRKTFTLPQADADKKIFIRFDGIYQQSEVWINEHLLGKRPNGYISFQYDLTPYLHFGDTTNVLAVKADNSQQPNSRWYSGSGIYRQVQLIKTGTPYIPYLGTFIQTNTLNADSAEVTFTTNIYNDQTEPVEAELVTTFYDPNGTAIKETTTTRHVASQTNISLEQTTVLTQPILWSLETPVLYKAHTWIVVNKQITDDYETTFGIRNIAFDSAQVFSLNGQHIKIKGVCLHHDLGCLGAAFYPRAAERQLQIMKRMGVNAIRTSHNPPAPQFLDLCDKMGFIVMDEAFDMWKLQKTEYDYHLAWNQWYDQDLEDQVKRDRNHPSVMIWSIGNEIVEQWNHTDTASGAQITYELTNRVKLLDRTRPVTAACNDISPDNPLIKAGALNIIGYNYHHEAYENFPKEHPGRRFIATETNSALATRGHYDMPSDSVRIWPLTWEKPFTEGNPDHTVSAYDNVRAPWGSTHEDTWNVVKKHDFISGMFIWTGFDYLGEPTPYGWPSRSSYFGVVDLAGFPKDTYYLYQSEWADTTMLHLFPHWNWTEGQTVDVWAYYNHADEIELYLNGASVGTRYKKEDRLHVMWRLPFSPGTLLAITRKDGQEVMRQEIHTAGPPAALQLQADRTQLTATGKDLAFVTVTVVDAQGNPVPNADNLLTFTITGEGTLAGTDNGDPVSHASFQAPERQAFHAKALAVIKSTRQPGNITLTVRAEGLPESTLHISTLKE